MSDYLEDVEYGKWRGETVETPRGRVLVRIPRAMVVAVGVGIVLAGVFLLVPPASQRHAPAEESPPAPPERLLADVTGEDVLWKLRITQAAMQREMALLRQWVSQGNGVSSAETDLAQAVSGLAARHEELGGLIGHLEAGLVSLREAVERNQAVLVILWEHLGIREETIEEFWPQERD